MDRALSRLDQASGDTAVILLDQAGDVSDWRAGATRLYGSESREMVGTGAAALFDECGRMEFPRLLAEERRSSPHRSCRQVRVDGTMFEAEIDGAWEMRSATFFPAAASSLAREAIFSAATTSTLARGA